VGSGRACQSRAPINVRGSHITNVPCFLPAPRCAQQTAAARLA
jgi:hypothetical protein